MHAGFVDARLQVGHLDPTRCFVCYLAGLVGIGDELSRSGRQVALERASTGPETAVRESELIGKKGILIDLAKGGSNAM